MTKSDDWRDDETERDHGAPVSPLAARLHGALGLVLGSVWIMFMSACARIAAALGDRPASDAARLRRRA